MNIHLRVLLNKEVHTLEYDPKAQYKFNLFFTWVWLAQMPIILILLIWLNRFWLIISIIYVAEISLWALVATHFGAMSACVSAISADEASRKLNEKGQ